MRHRLNSLWAEAGARLLLVLPPLLAVLLLSAQGVAAQGMQLATPVTAELSAEQQHYYSVIQQEPVYVSSIPVTLDFEVLEYTAFDQLLPDGRTVRIVRDQLIKHSEFNWEYIGHVDGAEMLQFNSVRRGDNFRAMISFLDYQYGIHPIGEGLHILTVENPQNYPLDHDPDEWEAIKDNTTHPRSQPHYDPVDPDAPSGVSEAAIPECGVSVLVAYTDDVAAAHVDPHLEIILANQNFNNANNNSAVFHDVVIVRIVEVFYTEAGTLSGCLNAFEGTSDGAMDNIHALRSLYDADLCQLITENSGGCGLASGIGSSYSTGFCVSDYGCIAGNLTYAHEFGHLYGARHDTYVDASTSPYAFGHGWTNIPDNWRTVMAYNDACIAAGTSCTRLQYWSNPAITFGGDPMGNAFTADNESVLDIEDNGGFYDISGNEAANTNKTIYENTSVFNDEYGFFFGNTTVNSGSNLVNIYSGGEMEIKAGTQIRLLPGFRSWTGSTFRAYISGSCNNLGDAPAKLAEDKPEESLQTGSVTAFPNPFTNMTRIVYTTVTDGPVNVTIYDMNGREVEVLANSSSQAAGRYELDFNGSNLAAGIYYARVQADDEIELLKLMIAR